MIRLGRMTAPRTSTVTVTATLADGFAWDDPPPDGWAVRSTGDGDVHRRAGRARRVTEVTPVAPTVVEAVCVDGALTAPTLTLPRPTGSRTALSAGPPYAPGADGGGDGDVGVDGCRLAGRRLPDGWTMHRGDDGDVRGEFDDAVVYAGDAGGSRRWCRRRVPTVW